MARFPRTLGDALAAQAEAARNTRTSVLSVDPLAPITQDHLGTELQQDLSELETQAATVDQRITDAINDNNAIPLTDERFDPNSLTVWPFVNGTVPQGALAPGAVGANDIADFSIAVRKFNSDRHHLY